MLRVDYATGHEFDSTPKRVAVLPVGSLERHGDHLPLGTDTIEASFIAEQVAARLCAHLYPPIWYGSSRGLAVFPGTIDAGDEALYHYARAVLGSIASQGYKAIVVVNGHGGNSHALRLAAKHVAYEKDIPVIVVDWWRDVAQEKRGKLFQYPGHAGEDETSAMLYILPQHVDMSRATDHLAEPIGVPAYSPAIDKLLYPRGVLGKASLASADKGREWLEAVVDDIVSKVSTLLNRLEKYGEEG